jgi:hypothetical protein
MSKQIIVYGTAWCFAKDGTQRGPPLLGALDLPFNATPCLSILTWQG